MTLDPDRPSPWSSPSTHTDLAAAVAPTPDSGPVMAPRPEPRERFMGKPRWFVVVIAIAIVAGALATALTVMAGGGLKEIPPPTFPPSAPSSGPAGSPAAQGLPTGVYQAPADLCQDADFTNLRPTFTTIGDLSTRGSTTPTLVVAGCDGSTGNDTVDGAFSFEVQVSTNPDALRDLFHAQRSALAARVPVTPVPGIGAEAFQYAALGQHGLSVDIYDANLIMRMSWTARHATDRLPAGLSQALVGTCRSTLRLLRKV
jgi:hypothetical protein